MSEITKNRANGKVPLIMLVMCALIIAAYFVGLNIPLLGPDEPRYSQVSREMFLRGDWITPTLGGEHWFEKPAFLYWLQICSYKVFGVSEFSARLGSALCGLATVGSLFIFGKRAGGLLSENGAELRSTFGRWLAVIAASTLGLLVFSHGASFDIIVTFPLTAAMVSYFIFVTHPADGRNRPFVALPAFYIFIALAVIAKGLIGVLFPVTSILSFHFLTKELPPKRFLISLLWGLPLCFLVAATWYLPMYYLHGYKFIDEFFIQHHFQRFTSNKYLHPQPFIFFFWVLPLMTLPWLPFFVAGLWRFGLSALSKNRTGVDQYLSFASNPVLAFALTWLAVPLIFFSLSGSKLPGYILPAVPAAVIVAAAFLYPYVLSRRNWRVFVLGTSGATLSVTVILLLFVLPSLADHDSTKALFNIAAEKGLARSRVINLHTVAHNAEFYAAGRIVRDERGKIRRLNGIWDIRALIEEDNGEPILVLVPLEYLTELTSSAAYKCDVLADNGETALVAVKLAS